MINLEQTHAEFYHFIDKHKLVNLGIEYDVIEKWEELNTSKENLKKLEEAKGLYLPAKKNLLIFSMNNRDVYDLRETLQHEIFGHVAINYLSSNQKVELLNSIEKEFKNPNSELREIIDKVQKQYPEVSSKHHAEEVFAYTAESTVINLEKTFKPFSLVRGNTKEKIESVVQNLAAGIREGTLKQRIFPKDNSDLGVDFSQSRPR